MSLICTVFSISRLLQILNNVSVTSD